MNLNKIAWRSLFSVLILLFVESARPAVPQAALAWGSTFYEQDVVPVEALNDMIAIAAGGYYTLALKSNGSVIAWGQGGSFGNVWGGYGQSLVPVAAQSGVIAIGAGGYHSLALKSDGSVIAWGKNDYGQTNVPLAAQSGVIALAAGNSHSVALKADGSVVAWGRNDLGQTSVPFAARTSVVAIAAGWGHNVALKDDGTVLAWGYNHHYQATVPPEARTGVIGIAAGTEHTAVLRSDGSVFVWGDGSLGQIFVPQAARSGVKAIAAGWGHTVALKQDGSVIAWGLNLSGEANVPVEARAGVTAIAAGYNHTVALVTPTMPAFVTPPANLTVEVGQSAGFPTVISGYPRFYQWRKDGTNLPSATNQNFGVGQTELSDAGGYTLVVSNAAGSVTSAPPAVLTVNAFPPLITAQPISLAAQEGESLRLSVEATGSLLHFQWLKDEVPITGAMSSIYTVAYAEPGDAGRYSVIVSNLLGSVTSAPPAVVMLSAFPPVISAGPTNQTIAEWESVTFAVTVTGSALKYQWRKNDVDITGATNETYLLENTRLSASGSYSVMVSNRLGSVISTSAALMVGPAAGTVFGAPAGLRDLIAVAQGSYYIPDGELNPQGFHMVALKRDGTVVAWGYNDLGESSVPTGIIVPDGLSGVVAIAAGPAHSVALKSDGTVVVWGAHRPAPAGLSNVVSIAAGGSYNGGGHTLAVRADGTVVAWGDTATNFAAGLTGVVAVAAASDHDLALKADGTVIAWMNDAVDNVPNGLNGVVAIAAGTDYRLALKSDGTLVTWQSDSYEHSIEPGPRLTLPGGLSGVIAIAAGGHYDSWDSREGRFGLALKSDGTAVQWGIYSGVPMSDGLTGITGIAAGQTGKALIVGDPFQGSAPGILIQAGAPGQTLLSWPVAAQGFSMESTANIADANSWTAVTKTVFNVDARKRVIEPSSGPAKFYRLVRR